MTKLIPADTVDLVGNVWETTGENIRHGVKDFYESEVKAIIDIMFPVGSVYCGENAFVLNVGTWSLISEQAKQFIASKSAISGTTITVNIPSGNPAQTSVYALRLWKRIS